MGRFEALIMRIGAIWPGAAAHAYVRPMQRGLGVAETGVFDEPMTEAVRVYQGARGVPVTGAIDRATANAMDRGVTVA